MVTSRSKLVLLLVGSLLLLALQVLAGVLDNRVDQYAFSGRSDDGGSCKLPDNLIQEIKGYQPIVDKIITKIVDGEFAGQTWQSLANLVDTFGARPAGSDQLEKAIESYRSAITLLNAAYKLLSQILCRRLAPREFVRQYQAGFMGECSNTNQVFAIRQVLQKLKD
ncbi:uncharacterized protein LOC134227540 [Armigeres subalbatus]|uniref:uncharacterized protein LOC134227540 n=1 Tax=Armigeres subalbatus TaxID=124917 RepID=UPI002ED5B7FA